MLKFQGTMLEKWQSLEIVEGRIITSAVCTDGKEGKETGLRVSQDITFKEE